MLEIKKDGYFLDLYPQTIISMEISNTILDDDIVNGSYSFPFKLPLTGLNKLLLNFPDEIASVDSIQVSDPVEVWCEGLLIFPTATMKIKDVNRVYINVYLLVGISTLAEYAETNKLADMMTDPPFVFDTTLLHADDVKAHAKATLTGTVDTFPYVFPMCVNDDHYQNILQDDPTGYTDHVTYNLYIHNDFVVLDQVVVKSQVTEAGTKHAKQTMVPFLYVTYVLRKILSGLKLTSNIFERDAQLKKLILMNQFCLDKWYPIFIAYFENRNNRAINLKEHVADQTVGQFIVDLKKVFCLFLYKDPFNDEIHLDAFKNIMSDNSYVDWSHLAVADFNMEETVGKGVKYLPDLSTDRIISGTFSMLGVTRKPAVQKETDLPVTGNTINDVRMVEETCQLYTWQFLFIFSTWVPITSALGDYYIDPAEFELKNEMAPCLSKNVTFYDTQFHDGPADYLIPVVGMPGSYEGNDNKVVANGIINKLLFYHGMQISNTHGRNFPMASSHNYDFFKNRIGEYSLAWDGQDGLYNVWWKDYIRMNSTTKQVTRDIQLTMPDLLNLNLRKKVRIGENNFLIRKLSLQLPLTKPASVELWKVD